MTLSIFTPTRHPAPPTYSALLRQMKAFVASKNVAWDITAESRWDFRALTGSHAAHATHLGLLEVDSAVRYAALEAGWPASALPQGTHLSDSVQDFVRMYVALRCREKRHSSSIQATIRHFRSFFSSCSKAPWEVSSEDISRFYELAGGRVNDDLRALRKLARFMNEELLSLNCPVVSPTAEDDGPELATKLTDRKAEDKLPPREAFYELARIVFQETPRTHSDAMCFYAVRLLLLMGLRINEVMLLPADCLVWKDHADEVTGKPAGEVGGISRSLRLRYFAEKQEGAAPDVLVERLVWVPTKFQDQVAKAVTLAQAATAGLRNILKSQHESTGPFSASDLRRFRLLGGGEICTSELLFLTLSKHRSELPENLPLDAPIRPMGDDRVRLRLGSGQGQPSLFEKYGQGDVSAFHVRPHSLRHLLNTELFRQNVPDTVITQQFGRTSVAQSYEYDHRSLAERLKAIALPPNIQSRVPPGSPSELVAKMVYSGAAASTHIGQSFVKIQREHGDEAAINYLIANSDGFHFTPYGLCVNSFSVNPCARHLKCFDNCKHYVATQQPQHVVMLGKLKDNHEKLLAKAKAASVNTVGRKNTIAHLESQLVGISQALETPPNQQVFPDGVDHSTPKKDVFQ